MRLLFARQCDQYADMMPVCQEVTDATGRPALGQGPKQKSKKK